jgi:NADPH-dependent 2,4-dienoyl-CoA reductase/sulfur reductase-like enzyme
VQEPVSCLVNPRTGKEEAYAIRRAEKAKKVMVIGGGPAGMEAAIVAAKRGHDVTLYDKADRLGGQWLLAAVPPGKEMLNAFTVWQKGELARSGVKVLLNTEVTAELVVAEVQPDAIVYAAGARRRPCRRFPAWKSPLCTRRRIFFPAKSTFGGHAVVIGGGIVGAETAEHLAVHGCTVTIVKRSADIAGDLPGAPRHFLMESLETVRRGASGEHENAGDHGERRSDREKRHSRLIPADLVVLASGSRPTMRWQRNWRANIPSRWSATPSPSARRWTA